MSDIKNSLKNIQSKSKLNQTVNTLAQNELHYNREPHGIYEGIRKDKKIKMNRKTFS